MVCRAHRDEDRQPPLADGLSQPRHDTIDWDDVARRLTALEQERHAGGRSLAIARPCVVCRTVRIEADLERLLADLEAEVVKLLGSSI